MKRTMVALFLVFAAPAWAQQQPSKQYAVVLTEEERAALVSLIDAAVRARGLEVAYNAVRLYDKINRASQVVEDKKD